ncbi:hypothetical protein DFH09DRAFT_1097007 [Mycena vulgaris]|nr:hypothetical protein DFH09DRAFT_1097007 [Mycena vulgaris]
MFPLNVFLPDVLITTILDNYALFLDLEHVNCVIQSHQFLSGYSARILGFLKGLKLEFMKVAANRKAGNALNLKKRKTVAAQSKVSDADKEVGEGSEVGDGDDVVMTNVAGPGVELRYYDESSEHQQRGKLGKGTTHVDKINCRASSTTLPAMQHAHSLSEKAAS